MLWLGNISTEKTLTGYDVYTVLLPVPKVEKSFCPELMFPCFSNNTENDRSTTGGDDTNQI